MRFTGIFLCAPNNKSYRVSFRKAKEELGFEAKISIEEGVREIVEKLESGELVDRPKSTP